MGLARSLAFLKAVALSGFDKSLEPHAQQVLPALPIVGLSSCRYLAGGPVRQADHCRRLFRLKLNGDETLDRAAHAHWPGQFQALGAFDPGDGCIQYPFVVAPILVKTAAQLGFKDNIFGCLRIQIGRTPPSRNLSFLLKGNYFDLT